MSCVPREDNELGLKHPLEVLSTRDGSRVLIESGLHYRVVCSTVSLSKHMISLAGQIY